MSQGVVVLRPGGMMVTARDIRVLSGWTKKRTAFMAGVSVGLLTLFEANVDAVRDKTKRATLRAIYADLAVLLGAIPVRPADCHDVGE